MRRQLGQATYNLPQDACPGAPTYLHPIFYFMCFK